MHEEAKAHRTGLVPVSVPSRTHTERTYTVTYSNTLVTHPGLAHTAKLLGSQPGAISLSRCAPGPRRPISVTQCPA